MSGEDIRSYEELVFTNVENVTNDTDRKQILVHGKMGEGIIAEFPSDVTMLMCRKPILRKIKN
jgi:hypothetical protein